MKKKDGLTQDKAMLGQVSLTSTAPVDGNFVNCELLSQIHPPEGPVVLQRGVDAVGWLLGNVKCCVGVSIDRG